MPRLALLGKPCPGQRFGALGVIPSAFPSAGRKGSLGGWGWEYTWCVGPEPELCDLCGVVIRDDSQVYGLVPDPGCDGGQRLITACSQEHLERVRLRWTG
jgi:hypothetical protein